MPPKKLKTEQYKPEEAKKVILSYLKDQYRPYAPTDLILNLHGKINKATMTKCLSDLVESDKILCKSFGKFNCYFCKPIDITDNNDLQLNVSRKSDNLEHHDLDTDLGGYEKELKKLQIQNITFQKELDILSMTPTNDELTKRFLEMKKEVENIEQVISESISWEDDTGSDSNNEYTVKGLKNNLSIILTRFKKRKQMFKNIERIMQENLENSKTIFDNIGISSDYMKLSDTLLAELTQFSDQT